jgi:GT2 family glycosyltransferase
MSKFAISIVLYAPDRLLLKEVIDALLLACLQLSSASKWTFAVDLVNNNPKETFLDEISKIAHDVSTSAFAVNLVESGINGGYGAGNNISIWRHKDADYHLVLNPDVLINEFALKNALEYMESNPDVGLLTPQVKGLDGTMHHLCKRNPTLLDMFIRSASLSTSNRFFLQRNIRYEMRDQDYEGIISPVPYPTGCFMLFRRSVLACIGGFDEGYFLHYEDADIGRSVSQVSKTAYVPSVVVLHKWSRDTHKSWYMRWVTIKSGLRYWRKWGGVF